MPKGFVLIIRSWGDGEQGGSRYFAIRFHNETSAERARAEIKKQDGEAFCIIVED